MKAYKHTVRLLAASLFLCLMSGIGLRAQTPVNGGGGYFRMANAIFDMTPVNKAFPGAGFSGQFNGFGGAGYALINNLIVGGEGMGYPGAVVSDGTISLKPVVAYGLFNLGYVIFRRDRLLLYPVAGIGAGALTIDIVERQGSPALEARRQVSARLTAFSLAAGADRYFMFGSGGGGVAISFRAGFFFGAQSGSWKGDDLRGRRTNVPGAFVSLGLGGGGWSHD